MNTDRPIGKLDLLAYIDGLLEPPRRAEVEAYLTAHPEESALVADCLKQNELLRELYDGPYREPLPAPLRRMLDDRPVVRPPSRLRRAAAALFLLLSGGAAGWWVGHADPFGTGVSEAFLRDVATAHAAARGADGLELELAADVDLPPLTWPVAAAVSAYGAPDLSLHNLVLVNRRAVSGPSGRQAVQLIYADVDGRLVSVYLGPRSPERAPEFRLTERGGFAVAYWRTDPVVHAVVGNLPGDEIVAVARSVQLSLNALEEGEAPAMPATGNGANNTALAPTLPAEPAAVESESADAAEM